MLNWIEGLLPSVEPSCIYNDGRAAWFFGASEVAPVFPVANPMWDASSLALASRVRGVVGEREDGISMSIRVRSQLEEQHCL